MTETITMSKKEAYRIGIFERLTKKELKQGKAAELLGISVRQVRRIWVRYRREGDSGITHALRGIPSNNRVDPAILEKAIITVKKNYPDFSISFAHEKLVKFHNFPYSDERLRLGLIEDGFWHPKRQKKPVIHQMRERRPCEGELVQIDGSPHRWFEDRGPACTLLVYIDDATGKLLWLEFVKSESTNAYFVATRHYLKRHGKPVSFYSDRHGVLRVNTTKKATAATDDSNGLTQFGRAMGELSIGMIFANSPQAKGRVERANQTLQDRLVKELRLQNIDTMNTGNEFLPTFIAEFNQHFSVIPKNTNNMHTPVTENLEDILVQKQERILSKNLSISYEDNLYQIETEHPTYAMRHARVTVYEDTQGNVTIHYNKETLPYTIIAKQPKTAIVNTKQVNQTVEEIKNRVWTKPSTTHPWKQPSLYW